MLDMKIEKRDRKRGGEKEEGKDTTEIRQKLQNSAEQEKEFCRRKRKEGRRKIGPNMDENKRERTT